MRERAERLELSYAPLNDATFEEQIVAGHIEAMRHRGVPDWLGQIALALRKLGPSVAGGVRLLTVTPPSRCVPVQHTRDVVDCEISRFPCKGRLHMPRFSTVPGRIGTRAGAPNPCCLPTVSYRASRTDLIRHRCAGPRDRACPDQNGVERVRQARRGGGRQGRAGRLQCAHAAKQQWCSHLRQWCCLTPRAGWS